MRVHVCVCTCALARTHCTQYNLRHAPLTTEPSLMLTCSTAHFKVDGCNGRFLPSGTRNGRIYFNKESGEGCIYFDSSRGYVGIALPTLTTHCSSFTRVQARSRSTCVCVCQLFASCTKKGKGIRACLTWR